MEHQKHETSACGTWKLKENCIGHMNEYQCTQICESQNPWKVYKSETHFKCNLKELALVKRGGY